jgi:hypothetical protein
VQCGQNLASSAIRCRFVDRFVRLKVLSRVSRQRFSPRDALPSLCRVPASPVPRRHRSYGGATTPTRRITGHLFGSLPVPTRVPLCSCSPSPALPGRWRSRGGPGSLFSRRSQLPAHSHVDVSGISQVPRRSVLCLCSGLGPRPNLRSLAITVSPMLPLLFRRQRLQRLTYRGYRGASAPAAYASWGMLPLPMQDSLPAGWLAFAGRELNPLNRDERFLSCYISSPFPGFILTLRNPSH